MAAPILGQFGRFSSPAISPSVFVNLVHAPGVVRLDIVDATSAITKIPMIDPQQGIGFSIQGVVNQTYAIETSSDFVDWVSLETNAIPISLEWQFTDGAGLLLPHQFYRVTFVP